MYKSTSPSVISNVKCSGIVDLNQWDYNHRLIIQGEQGNHIDTIDAWYYDYNELTTRINQIKKQRPTCTIVWYKLI